MKVADVTQHVAAFADYYRRNRAWGVFHVCLDDGNWDCGPAEPPYTDEEQRLVDIHEDLSKTQRRKLARLVDKLIREEGR